MSGLGSHARDSIDTASEGIALPSSPAAPSERVSVERAPILPRSGTPVVVPSSNEQEARARTADPEGNSPPVTAQPAETLPGQLDVLRRMRSALADQQGMQALAVYHENEAVFRGQALEPEARAALVAALCQVGRSDEARAEGERFQKTFPSSPLASRLAKGCGR